MAITFGVSCPSEEVKNKLGEMLDDIQFKKIQKDDGSYEKVKLYDRYAALQKALEIALENKDRMDMKAAGIDTDSLDASFQNIRALLVSAASSRAEMQHQYDIDLKKIQKEHKKMEETLNSRIDQLVSGKDASDQAAATAAKAAAQAVKDAEAAKVQASTAQELAEEKDRTARMLSSKLTEAEEKASGYDGLRMENEELKRRLDKAGLEQKNAVLEAQMDLMNQLREADRIIAELTRQLAESGEKVKAR